MNSSKSGSKKTTTALLLMIPSMIAATFIAGAAMLDMSAAYAQNPESNACKTQNNPQNKLNSNPHCVDDPVQGPPVPSGNAQAFQEEPPACENTGDNPNNPPPCLSGSRRR